MRLLHLDPIGGISGDMALGALVDLGVPLAHLTDGLAGLGVAGWRLSLRRRELAGLSAAKVDVVLDAQAPQPHRRWPDVRDLVRGGGLPARAEAIALEAFERLAHAESKVHDVAPEQVHFHEVGAVDAIVDVCGVALAVHHLAPDRIVAAPPPLGRGFVQAAHGRLPVPVPAVLELLRGLPVAACDTLGELTTPTGAALLATLADEVGPLPAMTLDRIGYGAGDATWPDRPNVLRAVVGEAQAGSAEVLVIEANLDDLTPEVLAGAMDAVLAAGALDVAVAPVSMKKGRPGHLLQVLCRPERREPVVQAMLAETTTFGVRIHPAERVELAREHRRVVTPWGPVRVKVGRLGRAVMSASPEYEDCRALAAAAGVPVKTVYVAALAEAGRHGMLAVSDEDER